MSNQFLSVFELNFKKVVTWLLFNYNLLSHVSSLQTPKYRIEISHDIAAHRGVVLSESVIYLL